MAEDKLFKIVFGSVLGAFLVFLILIVASVLFYAGPLSLASALLSEEVAFAIRLSLVTATVATFISLIVAVPTAYMMSRSKFFGRSLVDAMLNIPIVMSPVALGAALLIFFGTPAGTYWRDLFVFQVPGIILAQFMVISALAIRLMKNAFDGVDVRYENVSRTLGHNKFQTFFKVSLPLCKGSLASTAVLCWARAMGEFGATVMLAGATRMKTETLAIAISLSLASADVAKASALIAILIMVAILTLAIANKVSGKGVLV